MYAWGKIMQSASNVLPKVPDRTLSQIGYFTDDGAYYYQWEPFPGMKKGTVVNATRQWPAEVGLVKVKEALYAKGVPIAYMQLDDWWYGGYAYHGNGGVRAVVDWHADPSPLLFPNGLSSFVQKLGVPLMLYTPFFSDQYNWTKYQAGSPQVSSGANMKADQKLPKPESSQQFYSDLFSLGASQTNGRFVTYEMDFLGANFERYPLFFEEMHSADTWFKGMADAAGAFNLSIQYCLPSPTDMLVSLRFPQVTQGRASGDYGFPTGPEAKGEGNVVTLGFSSLLFGATGLAPSKDTLWTNGTQPGSVTWRGDPYDSQPHVVLDAVLAVLSLGPVGISDAYNWTDVGLIGQGFRTHNDGTLLRPSRPLSSVDSLLANSTHKGRPTYNLRSTHSEIQVATMDNNSSSSSSSSSSGGSGSGSSSTDGAPMSMVNTHYVVSWGSQPATSLGEGDLYPAPSHVTLASRAHVFEPGQGQTAGCTDGAHVSDGGCIILLTAGVAPTIPATKGAEVSLLSFYEPLPNGAYLLGELSKFVHVSPQRFADIALGGDGPCGFSVRVLGAADEAILVWAVDPQGVIRSADVHVGVSGSATAVF
jgi:hypothetical protein